MWYLDRAGTVLGRTVGSRTNSGGDSPHSGCDRPKIDVARNVSGRPFKNPVVSTDPDLLVKFEKESHVSTAPVIDTINSKGYKFDDKDKITPVPPRKL